MMIDTVSGRNLIKLNIIEHHVEINQNEILRLTGMYTFRSNYVGYFLIPNNN